MISKQVTSINGKHEPSICILTAVNDDYFAGLILLHASLKSSGLPLVCVDLSLNLHNRTWCRANDVVLLDFNKSDYIDDHMVGSLWAKPFMINECPYNEIIWIDSDAIVINDLDEFKKILSRGPVVTRDSWNESYCLNPIKLYELLPVPKGTNKSINAGVLGFNKQRDRELLHTWMWCVRKANDDPRIKANIKCSDQGALLWAIHAHGMTDHIRNDLRWNCTPNFSTYNEPRRERYKQSKTLFESIKADHPDIGIVHWVDQPKLWHLLD